MERIWNKAQTIGPNSIWQFYKCKWQIQKQEKEQVSWVAIREYQAYPTIQFFFDSWSQWSSWILVCHRNHSGRLMMFLWKQSCITRGSASNNTKVNHATSMYVFILLSFYIHMRILTHISISEVLRELNTNIHLR